MGLKYRPMFLLFLQKLAFQKTTATTDIRETKCSLIASCDFCRGSKQTWISAFSGDHCSCWSVVDEHWWKMLLKIALQSWVYFLCMSSVYALPPGHEQQCPFPPDVWCTSKEIAQSCGVSAASRRQIRHCVLTCWHTDKKRLETALGFPIYHYLLLDSPKWLSTLYCRTGHLELSVR